MSPKPPPAPPHGGTGDVKASANYAISLRTIEEGKKQGCSQVLFLDSNGTSASRGTGRHECLLRREEYALHASAARDDSAGNHARFGDPGGAGSRLDGGETPIQIDEAAEKIQAGRITEVFACGTAAVVIGIKELVFETGRRLVIGDGAAGEVTRKLNSELQGIQFGRLPDRHGWIETL